MVRGYALRYALDHPAVGRVTAISRRKFGISHSKLDEVVHRDFAECSALADALSVQDGAIFCLATYTGSMSDAELGKITVDCTVEFARALHGSSPSAAFSFLSGNGADRPKPNALRTLQGRGRECTTIPPAYIYPVKPRLEPNFTCRLSRAIYPAFPMLLPNQIIPADDLARAMVDVAIRETRERGGLVLENRGIRAMAEPRPSESIIGHGGQRTFL
jgi:hypothetical protein